jgi:hypothetical protein
VPNCFGVKVRTLKPVAADKFSSKHLIASVATRSQHVFVTSVVCITESVSFHRHKATLGAELRHEAGAAIQAADPYALWVFVNPKAWAMRKGRSK